MKIGEDHGMIRDLRDVIVDRLRNKCDVYNLWIDLPPLPPFEEPPHTVIKLTDDDYIRMDEEDDKFYMLDWLNTYEKTRWKGYVFCPPNTGLRKEVAETTRDALDEVFGIKLNDMATKLAKYAEY